MIICDIEIKTKKWNNIASPEEKIEKIIQQLIPLTNLKSVLNKSFTLELAVSLVSNPQIKKINNDFRGKDKATNILSFPALDHKEIHQKGLKNLIGNVNYLFLGDIVISYDKLTSEAKKQNKSFNCHLTHLILHSILHLIGYDHEDDSQAKEMENLEIKILESIKIKNPYQ